MEHLSMNYDDNNIPEIGLPGNSPATETIPDEMPRKNSSGKDTSNVIPDEVPQHDEPGTTIGDIPLEIPERGCPGKDSAYGQEVVL